MDDDNLFEQFRITASRLEAFKNNNQKSLVAMVYDQIGNYDLRDIYIEESIKLDLSDSNVFNLRAMQDKMELVPNEIMERRVKRFKNARAWNDLARLYIDMKDYKNALTYYLKHVQINLKKDKLFTSAYYLKEIYEEKLLEELFVMSHKQGGEERLASTD